MKTVTTIVTEVIVAEPQPEKIASCGIVTVAQIINKLFNKAH